MKFKNLKLRTKFGVVIVVMLLLSALVYSVASVTRTISDTQDNVDTFIRNSNGNYWEATGNNIQTAIDNLGLSAPVHGGWGGTHGYVWLPGNTTFTISGTIVIKEHVTLDMGGSEIQPNGNFDIIQFKKGSQLMNGVINVSGMATFDSACITSDPTDDIGMTDHTPYFYNLRLVSDEHRGKGIYLYTSDVHPAPQEALSRYANIQIDCFEYGIYLYHLDESSNSYLNGIQFAHIDIHNCTYPITTFKNKTECAGNFFDDIRVWCTSYTEYIIWNNGKGNFYEVMAYDWDNNSGTRTSYNFTMNATNDTIGAANWCYLKFHGGSDDIAVDAFLAYSDWPDGPYQNRWTFLDLEKGTLYIGSVNETG